MQLSFLCYYADVDNEWRPMTVILCYGCEHLDKPSQKFLSLFTLMFIQFSRYLSHKFYVSPKG